MVLSTFSCCHYTLTLSPSVISALAFQLSCCLLTCSLCHLLCSLCSYCSRLSLPSHTLTLSPTLKSLLSLFKTSLCLLTCSLCRLTVTSAAPTLFNTLVAFLRCTLCLCLLTRSLGLRSRSRLSCCLLKFSNDLYETHKLAEAALARQYHRGELSEL